MNNKIVNFEGQEVKVITNKGKVLINLVATANVCGLTREKRGKTEVRWRNNGYGIVEKLTKLSSTKDLGQQYIQEIEYILDDIDNTDDRNSIYMSSWLTKRFAMECHSDKAMQYKNFLATLDEQREQGLIPTNTQDIVTMVTNTVNAIIPQMVQQFVPMIQESKEQIEQSRKLLVDQANIYDVDRDKLKEMAGMKNINVKYATNKLKLVLSDYLGEKINAKDEIYREAKLRILCSLNCSKWEDIPTNRITELNNKINNVVDLFSEPLEIKEKYIHTKINKITRNNFIAKIETRIKNGIDYQKCSCCGEWKEMKSSNFYKDKNSSTGYKGICKQCKKNYYKENRTERLAYQNAKAHQSGVIPRSNYSFNKSKII